MAKGFKTGGVGGGVAGLNFEVVGGTTEPASPKENTIWVNTAEKITSWVFSATEPEAPEEGLVWIYTSTVSNVEFNALKKNGIQVYPISAKQYVSGAGVDVTAKSYQGGAWVDWIDRNLLYDLKDNELVTGGWVSNGSDITLTDNSGVLQIGNTAHNTWDFYYTKNKINLNGINTLCFTGQIYSTDNYCKLCVWQDVPNVSNSVAEIAGYQNTTYKTHSLSVEALNDSYYIGFIMYNAHNYVKMEKLWLE